MTSFVRAILIVCLLMQSIPGLAMQRCVAIPSASDLGGKGLPADAECACCGVDEGGGTIGCPARPQDSAGCDCRSPEPGGPTPAPPEGKNQRFEQWLASASVLFAVLAPKPPQVLARRAPEDSFARRPHPSIQSLLCVWRL